MLLLRRLWCPLPLSASSCWCGRPLTRSKWPPPRSLSARRCFGAKRVPFGERRSTCLMTLPATMPRTPPPPSWKSVIRPIRWLAPHLQASDPSLHTGNSISGLHLHFCDLTFWPKNTSFTVNGIKKCGGTNAESPPMWLLSLEPTLECLTTCRQFAQLHKLQCLGHLIRLNNLEVSLFRAFDECHRVCNALVDWRGRSLTLGADQCSLQTCLLFDVVDSEVRNGCLDPCDFGRSHRGHFCGAPPLWLLLGKHRISTDTRACSVGFIEGQRTEGGFGPRMTWSHPSKTSTLDHPLRSMTSRLTREQKNWKQPRHTREQCTVREKMAATRTLNTPADGRPFQRNF